MNTRGVYLGESVACVLQAAYKQRQITLPPGSAGKIDPGDVLHWLYNGQAS